MVILGLGTNQGDRMEHLRECVAELGLLLADMRCSSVYESAALLPDGAPKEWDIPYYNMAVAGNSALTPHELLAQVKALEKKLGRVSRGHWGPREIDIDILAVGHVTLHAPELTIPHAGLLERDFALVPLAEIAPQWVHPVAEKTAAEICAETNYKLTKIMSFRPTAGSGGI